MPFEGEGLTAESRKAHFPVQRRLREVRVDAADNKDPVGILLSVTFASCRAKTGG